jgi:hypothetical protein
VGPAAGLLQRLSQKLKSSGVLHRTCKEAVEASIFKLIQERLWWQTLWRVLADLKFA